MLQIRSKVFETNSSMTHCCVITTEDEFIRWDKGEVLFCEDNSNFKEADLAFEKNVEILEKKLKSKCCSLDKELVEKYKNKEISLGEVFSDSKFSLRKYYVTSDEWDSIFEETESDEYFEEKTTLATNPPVKVVAFGYYGAGY